MIYLSKDKRFHLYCTLTQIPKGSSRYIHPPSCANTPAHSGTQALQKEQLPCRAGCELYWQEPQSTVLIPSCLQGPCHQLSPSSQTILSSRQESPAESQALCISQGIWAGAVFKSNSCIMSTVVLAEQPVCSGALLLLHWDTLASLSKEASPCTASSQSRLLPTSPSHCWPAA